MSQSIPKIRCKWCGHSKRLHRIRKRGRNNSKFDGFCNAFGCVCHIDRIQIELGYCK